MMNMFDDRTGRLLTAFTPSHLNNCVVHPDNQLLTNFQWQVIVTIYNFQKN